MNPIRTSGWYSDYSPYWEKYSDYSPYWEKDNSAVIKMKKNEQRQSGPSDAKRKQLRKKRKN